MKRSNIKLLLSLLAIAAANSIIAMDLPPVYTETEEEIANRNARQADLDAEYQAASYPHGIFASHNEPADTKNIISLIRMGVSNPNEVNFELQKKNINSLPANDPQLNDLMLGYGVTILDYVITQRAQTTPEYRNDFDELISLLRAKGATGVLPIPQPPREKLG